MHLKQHLTLRNRQNMSDEDLMSLLVAGDRGAFDTLVNRHADHAGALAMRVTGRYFDAEEVVQEAFLRLWMQAATWSQQKGPFKAWFFRIVINLGIDNLRTKRREMVELDPETADSSPEIPFALYQAQLKKQIESEVAKLPLRQKTALQLCYYDGYSNAEAADIIGTTTGAVEALLVRARRRLHEHLTPLMKN